MSRARSLPAILGAFLSLATPAFAQDDVPFVPGNADAAALRGGKLLLTNGVSTVEGGSGGGIATWATIGGLEMPGDIGMTGNVTLIELPDFGFQSHGVALGISNRIELSYTRQNFDTRDVGTALGLGKEFTFNQDIFGAKLRLFGDLVYGDPLLPQVSIGVQHKRSRDAAIVRAVGGRDTKGTDIFISASKLFLSPSMLASATVRRTKGNQGGLLGFGGANGKHGRLQFEGSLAYQLSRRAVFGAEYRSKPDNFRLGEDDWMDVFAAYAVSDHVTITAAYADLGSIATVEDQRGAFLSAQIAL
ncbi:DUF3034 family protein [Croceicoccus hydrothermalis]|uniref:DUF3034 family protein n=1 Tax=Croceicoccus hydrothermalis TaxID=2867964 RepID=UPI001EFC1C31|nr:DUF3034 family protein [Croceicoccus hydrothermalis]